MTPNYSDIRRTADYTKSINYDDFGIGLTGSEFNTEGTYFYFIYGDFLMRHVIVFSENYCELTKRKNFDTLKICLQ